METRNAICIKEDAEHLAQMYAAYMAQQKDVDTGLSQLQMDDIIAQVKANERSDQMVSDRVTRWVLKANERLVLLFTKQCNQEF